MQRRTFRFGLGRRVAHGAVTREAGAAVLRGYGLSMVYPDGLVWANQVLEIFGDDCYGAGRMPEAPRIVDGGANIGTFALYATWLRPNARVIAIEPGRDNMEYLRKNLARNAATNVEMIPVALGAARGEGRLSGSESDALHLGENEGAPVDVVPLADFLDEHTDLLKLDIEGAEMDVLKAVPSMREVDRVVVEYHEYRGGPKRLPEMLAWFQKQGFDRFHVFGHRELCLEDPAMPEYCCLVETWRSIAN